MLLNHDRPILNTIAKDIAKLGRVKSISYFIQYEATCLTISSFIERSDAPRYSFSYGQIHRPTIYIHDSGLWEIKRIGCLAYQLTADTWALVCANEQTECSHDKGATVIGVLVLDAKTASINLVCLSADKRRVSLNPLNYNALAVKKHQGGYTTGLWPSIEQGQQLQVQFLHQGVEHQFSMDEQNLICPSSWLTLTDYQLIEVMPFCSAPKPPAQVVSALGKNTRALFGGVKGLWR